MYGFAEPLDFRSVVQLIKHYQDHSLICHNPTLDIKLLHPVSKNNIKDIEEDFEDVTKLEQKLNQLNKEFSEKTRLYDKYSTDYYRTGQGIQTQRQALVSFKACIALLSEQMKINANLQKQTLPHEMSTLRCHYQKLDYKMKAMVKDRLRLKKQLKTLINEHRMAEEELNSCKPVMKQLSKHRVSHKLIINLLLK